MDLFTLLLAAVPGLLIAVYIYYKDIHEPEPHKYLIWCFLFGVLSTMPAIWLEKFGMSLGYDESPDLWTTFIFAFVVVAGSEELVKFIFLRGYIYPKKEFNEPFDGIVYAVMIGMGFATLENILYAEYGLQTTIVRAFTAVPAHAAFAVIMGYYVGMAKFEEQNRTLTLAKGFFGAVILHGTYDFFIFQNNFPALAGLTIVTLLIGILLSRKMIKMHQQMSPFNTDEIEPMAEEISNELDFIPDNNNEEDEQEPFSLL
jgi:RsiW-degrading membrane proteinase PrsW (M82 family)